MSVLIETFEIVIFKIKIIFFEIKKSEMTFYVAEWQFIVAELKKFEMTFYIAK